MQQKGMDFKEIFSPVVRYDSLRVRVSNGNRKGPGDNAI
jgi:hypothetical protein